MMFDVLREENRNDEAYLIATQKDFPGWGFMLANGATTFWETWKYTDNVYSHNHPMFGSIDAWFYRSLLGINPASPGFEKILIKPQPTGDLRWAKGSYESIKGKIKSDWKIEGDQFLISLEIPINTKAELWIPSKTGGAIKEGNATLDSNVKFVGYKDGYAVIEIGSGIYSFQSILK
jgi:alpha-L-rhamnosidase